MCPDEMEQLHVELHGIRKTFKRGGEDLPVLRDVHMTVRAGAFECLVGPSGSGKSTLLNLVAGFDKPDQGTCRVAGADLGSMNDAALCRFRAAHIGVVFQSHQLIPALNAQDNVALPLLLARLPTPERSRRAHVALRIVGLEDRARHYPAQLSGGQEQRVAIARALVTDPLIVLADEPTGDLDRVSADQILDLLERVNRELGKTILLVTHDPLAAKRARVVRELNKGVLQ